MRQHRSVIAILCPILFSAALISAGAAAEPRKDPRCFTMVPVTNFDDKACAPVKVRIQFKDCTLGTPIENPVEAYARFECHSKPKQLKYWYQNAMLYGDLKKSEDTYEVYRTYSMKYDQEPAEPKAKPASKANAKATTLPAKKAEKAAVSAGAVDMSEAARLDKAQAEEKLKTAVTPAPTHAPSPTATPSPAPVAKAEPTPTPVPSPTKTVSNETEPTSTNLGAALSKVHLTGSIDTYYSYNFNDPSLTGAPAPYGASPAGSNLYVWPNSYHDSFSVLLARVGIYQDANPVGFRVDLGFGPLADLIAGSGSDAGTRALMQAYLTYKTPYGIVIDAGKFYSHFDFENVDPAQNWNFSYSFNFRYVTPTWGTGVRAKVPVGETMSVSLFLTNGVNNFYEQHRSRDFGAQWKWQPKENWEVIANYQGGDEGVGTSAFRNTYEAIAAWSPMESLRTAVDFALSTENATGTDARQANSSAIYVNYNFWKNLYVLPRYELYYDNGPTFGTGFTGGQTINSFTVGLEYRPDENFRLQGEYRLDSSTQQTYLNGSNLTGQQSIATLSAMILF